METLAAELSAFVPGEMERRGVPGVAVALVREGRVAWAAGFGIADPVFGAWLDEGANVNHRFEIVGGVMEAEGAERLTRFFRERREG